MRLRAGVVPAPQVSGEGVSGPPGQGGEGAGIAPVWYPRTIVAISMHSIQGSRFVSGPALAFLAFVAVAACQDGKSQSPISAGAGGSSGAVGSLGKRSCTDANPGAVGSQFDGSCVSAADCMAVLDMRIPCSYGWAIAASKAAVVKDKCLVPWQRSE